jgi:hypothetical protein
MRRATWQDAYDAQVALWRFHQSQAGRVYQLTHYEENTKGLSEQTRHLLAAMYRAEREAIQVAQTVFVADEMCDVVRAAAATFQPEPLYTTDLIENAGFLYYETPFEVPDRFDRPTTIAAISWAPVVTFHSDLDDRIRKELDLEPDADVREQAEAIAGHVAALKGLPLMKPLTGSDKHREWVADIAGNRDLVMDGIALTLYEHGGAWDSEVGRDGPEWKQLFLANTAAPPVFPMHYTPWWFGMEFDGNEVDENGQPTGAAWWWRIVQTTLRLMQQRIAAHHVERPARASRRDAERHGVRRQDVTVVRLRRTHGDTGELETPGDRAPYSHRFIVSGHWRNQPYPSEGENVHRQIWISPYVKGPEDAPLRVAPQRVYVWSR